MSSSSSIDDGHVGAALPPCKHTESARIKSILNGLVSIVAEVLEITTYASKKRETAHKDYE